MCVNQTNGSQDVASACDELEYEPERVQIGHNISLEVLTVVPPPIEFMSTLHSQKQEISGRQLWTGSLLLANVLHHHYYCTENCCGQEDVVFNNQRFLELGSGTGVLGMTIAKLGKPLCVVMTDGDPQAVELLQSNLKNPFNDLDASRIGCTQLSWGDKNSIRQMQDWCQTQDNWANHSNDNGTTDDVPLFDTVVAGDVLYKAELPKLLFDTARSLLHPEHGVLWLCHVPRANVTQEVVVQAAQEAGFAVQKIHKDEDLQVPHCPMEDLSRAQVYRMTLKV